MTGAVVTARDARERAALLRSLGFALDMPDDVAAFFADNLPSANGDGAGLHEFAIYRTGFMEGRKHGMDLAVELADAVEESGLADALEHGGFVAAKAKPNRRTRRRRGKRGR